MSLANLIVQPHAAYLYTDCGYFDADGVILKLEHKIMPFPEQSLAIAGTGAGKLNPSLLFDEMERLGMHDLDQMAFLRRFRSLVRGSCPENVDGTDREDRRYMIGLYSHKHQRAMGLTIFTPGMGPEGKEPYEYHPADIVIAPMVQPNEAFGSRKINVTVPSSFDPVADGRALADAQRRKVTGWSHGVADGSRVAGDIMMTEVSARGVNFQILQQNQETVGMKVAAGQSAPVD